MFGRRKQQQEEAAREAERRALFEELAKRPDTICPFLGLENARTEFRDRVSDGHRCYAFGDPADLSAEQQQRVCLQRGYGNCPRYLRGVLVIPTEELEALRHPQPAPPPPAPAPAPAAAASGGGSRRGLVAAVVVLLLALGGGGGAFLALSGEGGISQETPSPTASPISSATEPGTPSPSTAPSAPPSTAPTMTPEPTPIVIASDEALPTPGPSDTPTGFAIRLDGGEYPCLILDTDGSVEGSAACAFDGPSWAPVSRIVLDGDVYWRTLIGGYTGRAYSRALSGNGFVVYETFESPNGEARFRELDESEY